MFVVFAHHRTTKPESCQTNLSFLGRTRWTKEQKNLNCPCKYSYSLTTVQKLNWILQAAMCHFHPKAQVIAIRIFDLTEHFSTSHGETHGTTTARVVRITSLKFNSVNTATRQVALRKKTNKAYLPGNVQPISPVFLRLQPSEASPSFPHCEPTEIVWNKVHFFFFF